MHPDIFFILRKGSFIITYAEFSKKLTFLTSWYAHVRVRIRGSQMLVFRNILPTYSMNDPKGYIQQWFSESCFVLRKLDLLWFKVTTGLKWNLSGSSEFLSLCQYLIKCLLPLILHTLWVHSNITKSCSVISSHLSHQWFRDYLIEMYCKLAWSVSYF